MIRSLFTLLLLALATGCVTPWQPLHEGRGWTLYVQDASEIEIAPYEEAFEAGRKTVEQHFGPFQEHVAVYAWHGGIRMDDGVRGQVERGEEVVQDVPGIGPARVRAFHARGSDLFGTRSGVFLGQADVGTTVHELVHARLAEMGVEYPLWFEEGLASLLGDGAYFNGCWQVDGLACWPLRELSEEQLNDAQLQLLVCLKPGDEHDLRTNVLVHFLGWALIFDLYREEGALNWRDWADRYTNGIAIAEVRRRMNRTLARDCCTNWLERLSDEDPAVRFAAVRGIWKLRSRSVASTLLEAIREEEDVDVQTCMAVNVLATYYETYIGRRNRRHMWFRAMPLLRRPQVDDPIERQALRTFYDRYVYEASTEEAEAALSELSRYLEE